MNHAPRFTIGQEVITPKHGSGVIKWIYAAPRQRVRTRYSVIVAKRAAALVLDEAQIKPKDPGATGPEVHCRDCGHNNKVLVKTSILCGATNFYRKPDEPRLCKYFTPRQPAQGG